MYDGASNMVKIDKEQLQDENQLHGCSWSYEK